MYLGHALIEDSAGALGQHWVAPLLAVVTALYAGTLLRAGARVFLGWGEARDPLLSPEPPDDRSGEGEEEPRAEALLIAPAAVLAALALAVGPLTGLETEAKRAAERFVDTREYAAHVLDHAPPKAVPEVPHVTTGESVLWASLSALGAVGVALFGLYRRRLPERVRSGAARALSRPSVVFGPFTAGTSATTSHGRRRAAQCSAACSRWA